jgi:hypothetical protein
MKTTLLILLLSFAALADNNGNGSIPVKGCYCEPPGWYRSGAVMVVGDRYTLQKNQREAVYVVIMPDSVQSLGAIAPGETREVTARGESLLAMSYWLRGQKVELKLRRVK